nr:hypothetical protein BAR15_180069 [Bartonella sp. AR 15-3]
MMHFTLPRHKNLFYTCPKDQNTEHLITISEEKDFHSLLPNLLKEICVIFGLIFHSMLNSSSAFSLALCCC